MVALYLNPPLNALVLSVDEKPSIQAIERASGYVETDSGKVMRAMKSTYKRHGTRRYCIAPPANRWKEYQRLDIPAMLCEHHANARMNDSQEV